MRARTTANVAMITAPGLLRFVQQQLPPPAAGQVLLRVTECGICGSDVDVFLGKAPEKFPMVVGHEFAGVVEQLGAGVEGLRPGDRVAAWVPEGCGLADRAVVEARYCVPVAEGVLNPAVAEPLACCVNVVEQAAPAVGDDIVIVGGGFMANLVQMLTALEGAASITVAARREYQLDRARELGASRVVDLTRESLVDVVGEQTDGRGADVTYEVTGAQAGLDLAEPVTRMSGKIVIVGYHLGGRRSLDLGRWNAMGYEIVNAHFRDVDAVVDGMHAGMALVNSGALKPAALVTHRFGFAEAAKAFEVAAARPEGFTKAVIEIS